MEIYVYEMSEKGVLSFKGITDKVKLLCWTRRFFTGDSFDAVLPADAHNLGLIRPGRIIEIPGRYSGFITAMNAESGLISLSGRSFTGMLARRVLMEGSPYGDDSLMTVLDKNAGTAASLAKRSFPGAVFDKTVDCSGTYGDSLKFGSLEKYAEAAGKRSGFGVRSEIVHCEKPYIRFYGKFRADRSAGQTENLPVIFSDVYGNTRSLGYSHSESGAMTNAVVFAGEKEGLPPWQVCFGDYHGWNSVEKAFETEHIITYATQISGTGDDAHTVSVPVTDYKAMYETGTAIHISKYAGFTDKINASLVIDDNYREIFDTGDIATVHSSELNTTKNMTIYEVTERFENGGFTAEAVLASD